VEWTPSPTFWAQRPVAVTGATGFVGAHVVAALLDAGAEVAILVRDEVPPTSVSAAWSGRVTVVQGSVEDQAVVERLLGEHGIATLVHLAAQSQVGVANRNPVSTWEANITGTWTVLEAARRTASVRQVVTASSDKAYGAQAALPYDETMALDAVNPYDVSKACADLIARSYASTWGLPVATTRCGNFFGPGDVNWQRIVPGTIRSLLAGEAPLIRSDGTMVRDYLYVVDGARAYLQVVEALAADGGLAGEAFNFSTEEPVSVLELVARIQAAMGTDRTPDVRNEATHEIPEQHLSAAKAREVLGWQPSLTLDEALAPTIEWYRSELDQGS
jgi:CDP-glucose 4,6-dehydratase